MTLCLVCGNEIARGAKVCRFCGNPQNENVSIAADNVHTFRHKVVNLEQGRPVVETALNRLNHEIEHARSNRVQVLTLIHGYGSSGKGGAIRRECRKTLDFMCCKGHLESYIPGEEFSRKAGPTRSLLRRYPLLVRDKNLNRNNPGITLVVL